MLCCLKASSVCLSYFVTGLEYLSRGEREERKELHLIFSCILFVMCHFSSFLVPLLRSLSLSLLFSCLSETLFDCLSLEASDLDWIFIYIMHTYSKLAESIRKVFFHLWDRTE
ncbi:hypothetical protein BJX64DRAFT_68615 [Aspergillus heterothallicus]